MNGNNRVGALSNPIERREHYTRFVTENLTAYEEAVREGYLWHGFGDSHLILIGPPMNAV